MNKLQQTSTGGCSITNSYATHESQDLEGWRTRLQIQREDGYIKVDTNFSVPEIGSSDVWASYLTTFSDKGSDCSINKNRKYKKVNIIKSMINQITSEERVKWSRVWCVMRRQKMVCHFTQEEMLCINCLLAWKSRRFDEYTFLEESGVPQLLLWLGSAY